MDGTRDGTGDGMRDGAGATITDGVTANTVVIVTDAGHLGRHIKHSGTLMRKNTIAVITLAFLALSGAAVA